MDEIEYTREEAIELYESFADFEKQRNNELTEILKPYIEVTEEYGKLLSRVSFLTGHISPKDKYERIQRDLFADVFDFLYETRTLIIKGKYNIAYPLARKAFESLTLKIALYFDTKEAEKWDKGIQIQNKDVRNILNSNKDKGGEPLAETRKMYNFFSNRSHPNGHFLPRRSLGEGNRFVLGGISIPLLVSMFELCININELWHWFGAYEFYYNKCYIDKYDLEFKTDYVNTTTKSKELNKWLHENFNKLLEEYKIMSENEL